MLKHNILSIFNKIIIQYGAGFLNLHKTSKSDKIQNYN